MDPSSNFVLRLTTTDPNAAAQAVATARKLRRPLLLRGLLTPHVAHFDPARMAALPPDLRVAPDGGAGAQPLCEWVRPSGRGRMGVSGSGIATIMSAKARQALMWERFLKPDLAAFREASGFTALAAFVAKCFGRGKAAASGNLVVTSDAGPGGFQQRSDVHQDEYDNFMVVAAGAKIWALAILTDAQVARAGRRKGRLARSLALDAVDRTRNRTPDEHDVAAAFETVYMGPGDVLFNPALVWHQVNSEPGTLAYSLMYDDAAQSVM